MNIYLLDTYKSGLQHDQNHRGVFCLRNKRAIVSHAITEMHLCGISCLMHPLFCELYNETVSDVFMCVISAGAMLPCEHRASKLSQNIA